MRDRSRGDQRSIPMLSRAGTAVMIFGLLYDTVEHTLVNHATETRLGQFPVSEHAAHLVVFIGMVLVLAGVLIDGLRPQPPRKHGKERHASR